MYFSNSEFLRERGMPKVSTLILNSLSHHTINIRAKTPVNSKPYMYMYKRYVDDINVIVGAVEPGAKIAGGMLTIDEKSKAQDSHRHKDEMCMELLKEVGNSIHSSIQIEVDYPSRHDDNLMPILHLKVWIDRKNVIMNGKDCTVNVILHEFYAKEVSSKMMLSSCSALPMKVKRTMLTQEVLRVLLNCNPEIPWERTVDHVNNMIKRMQYIWMVWIGPFLSLC